MKKCAYLILLILGLVAIRVTAEESSKIEINDTIKGNHQHPNVLFIVPWQSPANSIPAARNMAIRLPNELMQPIERAYFVEQYVRLKKINE
jgi:hypothetical protein